MRWCRDRGGCGATRRASFCRLPLAMDPVFILATKQLVQIRILWEELLNREVEFEVLAPPTRMSSNFIRGISELPVKISYR